MRNEEDITSTLTDNPYETPHEWSEKESNKFYHNYFKLFKKISKNTLICGSISTIAVGSLTAYQELNYHSFASSVDYIIPFILGVLPSTIVSTIFLSSNITLE